MKYTLALALILATGSAYAGCASRVSTNVEGDQVVSTNTVVVCQDGSKPVIKPRPQVGDSILENEVPRIPQEELDAQKAPLWFKHKGSKCRLFRERYMLNAKLVSAYGTLCQLDPNSDYWQVVDKW